MLRATNTYMSDHMIIAFYACVRTLIGIVTRPYETYRHVINDGSYWELVPLTVIIGSYLGVASLVKTAAFRPYMLTKQFMVLTFAVLITFGLVVGLLWFIGKLIGGKGTIRGVILGWAYTLIPTVCWFYITSLLYVLIPPPRTNSPLGILFSALFLLFSSILFFWKVMLTYLTVRFGLKLDLPRISIIFFVVIPMVVFYGIGMYRLGIFKIPFI